MTNLKPTISSPNCNSTIQYWIARSTTPPMVNTDVDLRARRGHMVASYWHSDAGEVFNGTAYIVWHWCTPFTHSVDPRDSKFFFGMLEESWIVPGGSSDSSLVSHAIPCHAKPCHGMPCHAMPCHTMPCHASPCHAMSSHAMPCHAMPCHAMPCHAMAWHGTARHGMACRATVPAIFVYLQLVVPRCGTTVILHLFLKFYH